MKKQFILVLLSFSFLLSFSQTEQETVQFIRTELSFENWIFEISKAGMISLKTNFGEESKSPGVYKVNYRFEIQEVMFKVTNRTITIASKKGKALTLKYKGLPAPKEKALIAIFGGRAIKIKNALIHLQKLTESKKPLFSE
jgi:hypothetical protein